MGRNCKPTTMPEVDPAAREPQHQPGLGHRLHPGARYRDELGGEVEAEIPDPERAERLAGCRTHCGHGSLQCIEALEQDGQVAEGPPLLGRQAEQLLGEKGVLERPVVIEDPASRCAEGHPGHPAGRRDRPPGSRSPSPPVPPRRGSSRAVAPIRGPPVHPGWASPAGPRWPGPTPVTGSVRRRSAGAAGGAAE